MMADSCHHVMSRSTQEVQVFSSIPCDSNDRPVPPHRKFFYRRPCQVLLALMALGGHSLVVNRKMLHRAVIKAHLQKTLVPLKLTINNTVVQVQNISYAEHTGRIDNTLQIHNHSILRSPMVIDLLPWELQSIQQFTKVRRKRRFVVVPACQPPDGVPDTCCLGSVSTRGGMTRGSAGICFKGGAAYTKVAHAALKELQKSEALVVDTGECDVCRVVEIVYQHHLKFVITGDSMMLQTFSGFWCELSRRGYVVKENTTYHTYSSMDEGIRGFTDLTISGPVHWYKPIRVTFLSQYLPNITEMSHIASTADVLLMNFGLHWSWIYRRKYRAIMTDVLNATKRGNIQLLAYRETSAQHFQNTVGEYYNGIPTYPCFPWLENSTQSRLYRWRERAVQETAVKFGYRVVVADESLPRIGRIRHNERELVILPFYNFTSQLHDMHPGECTHYCSTPFLWMPLWRNLRLAMDQQWNDTTD